MGNVPLAAQIQGGGGGALTEFQKNKLTFDFNTFFDLNHDGFLSYKVISYIIWQALQHIQFRTSSGQRTEYAKCLDGK